MISAEEIVLIIALIIGISMALSIGYVLGYNKGKQEVCEAWNIAEKPRKTHWFTYQCDYEEKPIYDFVVGYIHSAEAGMEKEYIDKQIKEQSNE